MGDEIGLNLERVRERIRRACRRANRSEDEVTLIAVTKTVSEERIQAAIDRGVRHIGENRVQEAREKLPSISGSVTRHMIGHLQTNKVRYVGELFDWVHSLDRERLAREMGKRAEKEARVYDCLVQVNIADEETKYGLAPDAVSEFVRRVSDIGGVRIRGLMTIAPLTADEAKLREVFRSLRALAGTLDRLNIPNVSMEHLSMGMSNDFEIAIEEGATMVRIGSAIFGPRS